ncbi:Hypothetical predicted protein [Mytilus galloprovincialis]|uniref:Ig-like domain-containing protein n=1 Tax=Mytilus galloprovincialis TaxID=29158 RepID=A0A8B6E9Q0_MYTGA|nr:Hypothetical predicted protein [Mytilus galloprovincialis]
MTQNLPSVSIGTRLHESDFGSSYTIECKVIAHPAHTTVYWQHNYNGIIRTIKNDTLGVSGIFIDNPSLTIDFITTSDSGKYTCIAENVVGVGKSQDVDLKVNGGTFNY